jgi:tetratricopeptide (TPR) repeat protein
VSFARRRGAWRYALVALCLALGLMAKPMLVSLPFVLLLLDAWPLSRWRAAGGTQSAGRLVVEKLPLFVLVALSCAMTYHAQSSAGVISSLERLSLLERLANASSAYAIYVGQTLWPAGLACVYPHAAIGAGDRWSALFLPAIACGVPLVALTALVLWRPRARLHLPVGWLWYLGTLVPVIGIVQVGTQSHADRYTYLPSIGLALMIAWSAQRFLEGKAAGVRKAAFVLGALWLTALGAASYAQVGTWRDSESLWARALSVTTDNHTAHYHMGVTLARAERIDEAIEHFREALRIRPRYGKAHYGMAAALSRKGRRQEAEPYWLEAARLRPRHARTHLGLGLHFAGLDRHAEAVQAYERALELDATLHDARLNLGLSLNKLGRFEEARSELERMLSVRRRHPGAMQALGFALLNLECFEEAERHLLRALEIRPNYTEARMTLAAVYLRQQRDEEAASVLRKVLDRNPGHAGAERMMESIRSRSE